MAKTGPRPITFGSLKTVTVIKIKIRSESAVKILSFFSVSNYIKQERARKLPRSALLVRRAGRPHVSGITV